MRKSPWTYDLYPSTALIKAGIVAMVLAFLAVAAWALDAEYAYNTFNTLYAASQNRVNITTVEKQFCANPHTFVYGPAYVCVNRKGELTFADDSGKCGESSNPVGTR
jgi:hypothetical protein